MADLKNTSIDGTVFRLPAGTTSQRPASPNARQIRFNTETGQIEFYDNNLGNWLLSNTQGIVATGGEIVDNAIDGAVYRTHIFTQAGSNTLNIFRGGEVEYLIVAGGGGGGSGEGGGGGAGGLLQGQTTLTSQSYTIIVGNGGTGADYGSSINPTDGEDSSAFGFTAIGGGSGGSRRRNRVDGNDGGSGGGGGGENGGPGGSGGSGTPGQGFDGGTGGSTVGDEYPSAGGGGAGGPGETFNNYVTPNGYKGGPGISTNISGEKFYYAGGGGGGVIAGSYTPGMFGGLGGLGGGGKGGDSRSSSELEAGFPGMPNTGGGGGGGGYQRDGANGGDGIVIVRYLLTENNPIDSVTDFTNNLILELDAGKQTDYPEVNNTARDSYDGPVEFEINNSPRLFGRGSHRGFFEFDGSSTYLEGNLFNETGDWAHSIVFWIRLSVPITSQSNGNPIQIGNSASSSQYSAVELDSGGFNWYFYANDLRVTGNTMIPNTGVWTHIALTYQGGGANNSNKKLYSNAVEITPNATGGSGANLNIAKNAFINIGRDRNRSGRHLEGDLSLVRIYNRGLTPEEVQATYDATKWRFE